ncbi:DUF3142 domain-containing protein [Aeromonas veronii]|uniref:DUF3142 domain-containing protein n=1 Tax=Aeromonas veronii TaxID=654 RepID=UPI00226CA921|nr:DUF3142 domain-containing protein [Aeromonas veronii]MCX9105608.1 DUF3142 domain-containing protein [Aeromonas veronii]MCX9121245.1 DUF3142 domain-containing protein [Aeromonas veronii]
MPQPLVPSLLILLSTLAAPLKASVYANSYDAFWLWSATRHQPVLAQATTLYLHQGEILNRPSGPRFIKLGRAPTPLQTEQLWLVVRVNTLPLSADHKKLLVKLYQEWRKVGAKVTGIQIDFDAATRQLDRYATSLRQLRQVLPAECKLSVTGLLDWAKTGDVAQLNSLPVDEIVIQTYQGKHTVPGYSAYLPAMMQLTIPFKVGLVQEGEWEPSWQAKLATSPHYRGEVVFLINR